MNGAAAAAAAMYGTGEWVKRRRRGEVRKTVCFPQIFSFLDSPFSSDFILVGADEWSGGDNSSSNVWDGRAGKA